MSVIACVVSEDTITVAADSITYYEGVGVAIAERPKIFKVNGMIMASVGTSEEGGMMEIFCQSHRPERPDRSAILTFMSEFSKWKRDRTDDGGIEGCYIMALEEYFKAFHIYQWDIAEIKRYAANGAGMNFALAALHLGHTPHDAVKVACELSAYCIEPVIQFTINRKGKEHD